MSAVRAIPSDRVAILFLVMLVSAAGNTAMQSALPAIASELDIADVWVSLAFSWSALLWVLMAPRWARLSDKRGRKALMSLGVIGFVSSMGMCGLMLWLGLNGYIGPALTFIGFALFRSLYGGFGSAAPPAVQAYIAARTEREERAKALSLARILFWSWHGDRPGTGAFPDLPAFWSGGALGGLCLIWHRGADCAQDAAAQ